MRVIRWVCIAVLLATASLASSLVAPAWACGCGAYIPDRAGAAVTTERAFIAWDGATEHIVMSFDVAGGSDKAAWVMPVPSTAEVSLGDAKAFDELARLTAPRTEYREDWWPNFDWLVSGADSDRVAARAPAGVNVLDRQRIGPFEVTKLAADDPAALAHWLSENGFPNPEGLEQNLAHYVADRWQLVAIKLAPADPDGRLTGQLQPLTLSFASPEVSYPMRLSRSATVPQAIDLYVLAEHRMDPTTIPVAGEQPDLEFAGRLDPATTGPSLQPYLTNGTFLTRWTNTLAQPSLIDDDYTFAVAGADTTYQRVVYFTIDRGADTSLMLIAAIVLGGLVIVIVSVRRRRSRIGSPGA